MSQWRRHVPGRAQARIARARLAAEGRRLPLLGDDDRTANREYIRDFVLDRDRAAGAPHGLAHAEAFHYISSPPDAVQEYLRQHAVRR